MRKLTLYPALGMLEIDILAPLNSYLLLICVFFIACSDLSEFDKTQVKEALADSLLSSTVSNKVEITFLEEEQLKLIITADRASTLTEKNLNETHIEGNVHIEVFDADKTKTTIVDSNRAIYYPKRSEFELFGDVFVQTSTQKTLRSEYLKWERGSGLISSPEFVLIITETDSITGKGFEGQSDLSEFTISQGSGTTTVNNE